MRKFCPECSMYFDEDADVCEECGGELQCDHSVKAKSKKKKKPHKVEGYQVTKNIYLCDDGVYRWVYEFDMLRNPVILFTVLKVLALSAAIAFAIVAIGVLLSGNYTHTEMSSYDVRNLKIVGCVLMGCILFSYLLVAARKGYKYCVLFEMDEDSVKHTELPKSYKKTEVLNQITTLVGAITGNLSAMGAGILANSKRFSLSNFLSVKSVEVLRNYHTIKVNELLEKNQVYAEKEDFDFVLNYILEHVPSEVAQKTRR